MVHLIIINLKKRADRWKSIIEHLNTLQNQNQLKFIESIHRLEAVVGNPPAKGCMQSHANAIQLAKTMGWNSVMVMEDDARFINNADEIWNAIQDELKEKETVWKIIFGATVRLGRRGIKYHSPHLLALDQDGIFTGTHCMVYHSRCYDEVIELIEKEVASPFPYHIDLLLSSHKPFISSIYLMIPFIALFLEHDTSDIRQGKDTSIDYEQIVHANKMSQQLLFSLSQRLRS